MTDEMNPAEPEPPTSEAPRETEVSDIEAHEIGAPASEVPNPEPPSAPTALMIAPPPIEAPPEPPPPPVLPQPAKPRRTPREHVWAVLCHLMLFLAIPTVFLGGVITFFLWQIKGGRDAQVEDQGREALNFQINVAVLTALLSITFFGVALVPIVWLVAAIFCLIAARKAAEGEQYRYPWILRVVTH
jgi:uncharacterized Tic20 family protein